MHSINRASTGGPRFASLRNFPRFVGIALLCIPTLASASDLRTGVETLAGDLLAKLPADRRPTIAVTDFPDLQGVTSDLSRYIAERLTTILSQSQRVAVVERRRVTQVLAELGWTQGDLLNPDKAAQLGQKTGIGAIVLGSMVDLTAAVEVEARLVALETGEVQAVSSVTIPKDESVGAMMARGRQVPAPLTGPSLPKSPRELANLPAGGLAPRDLLTYSTPGGHWKYEIKIEREEGLIFKRKVSEQGILMLANDGEVPFLAGNAIFLRGELRIGTVARGESVYYRLSEQTVEQIGEEHEQADGQKITITYDHPIVLWRTGGKAGDQWETTVQGTVQGGTPRKSQEAFSPSPSGGSIRLDVLLNRLIEGIFAAMSSPAEGSNVVKVTVGPVEKIATPLGDFDGQRIELQQGKLSIMDWHVPGIGLAKRIKASPKGRVEATLVEYSVPQ